jgi:hypothetical protein
MSHLEPQTSPFKDYESGGIAVAGFSVVGLGVGIWLGSHYHSLAIGISSLLIGVGVGLVVMAIISRDR